ncbi:MAG TPA: pyridoxamine 5'-phosphate oxidase family protein [Actinomycetota bacterium]
MQPTVAGKPWEEFLAERPLGVIATVGAEGMPHAVPVEVVVRDGRAYVWCRGASRKARNAARDGRAALVAYKGNNGVLLRGRVRLIVAGEPGYEAISTAFLTKYERDEGYGNDTLIEIIPHRVTTFG